MDTPFDITELNKEIEQFIKEYKHKPTKEQFKEYIKNKGIDTNDLIK